MTDYLVRQTGSRLVARYNGGAQAGHTVTANGKRHVFGHVGAGTFAGADTYLTNEFIVNPYLLTREVINLDAMGHQPEVMVSEQARVTTIYDMAINAAVELARGAGRHGSCGLGINETVTRHAANWTLTVNDVKAGSFNNLVKRLQMIHTQWVPHRLSELGLSDMPEEFHTLTGNTLINGDYQSHARIITDALNDVILVSRRFSGAGAAPVIFEGAQGLALDEELGEFPHVTRSVTGLVGAIRACDELDVDVIKPVYVTRAYLTRHGAGPLPNEGVTFTEQLLTDRTNIHNQWQGSFRYAPLDLRQMGRYIHADLKRAHRSTSKVFIEDPVIAITCMDQVDGSLVIFDASGERRTIQSKDLPEIVTSQLGIPVRYISEGPTAQTVVLLP